MMSFTSGHPYFEGGASLRFFMSAGRPTTQNRSLFPFIDCEAPFYLSCPPKKTRGFPHLSNEVYSTKVRRVICSIPFPPLLYGVFSSTSNKKPPPPKTPQTLDRPPLSVPPFPCLTLAPLSLYPRSNRKLNIHGVTARMVSSRFGQFARTVLFRRLRLSLSLMNAAMLGMEPYTRPLPPFPFSPPSRFNVQTLVPVLHQDLCGFFFPSAGQIEGV